MTDDFSLLIGVSIALIGTTVSNFGVNLQKYAQIRLLALPPEERVSFFKYPFWIVGFVVALIGNILTAIIALSFVPQSIVAPIYSFTLVANLFWAKVFLKETFAKTDFIGVFFIVVGAILAVALGSRVSTNDYDINDFTDLFQEIPFIVFGIIILLILIIEFYLCLIKINPLRKKIQQCIDSINYININGKSANQNGNISIITSIEEVEKELEEVKTEYSKWIKIHPFINCSLCGILGAMQIFLAKICVQLLLETFDGNNQFNHFLTYLFLVSFVISGYLQVHYINQTLRYFDSLYCIPIYQCFLVIFNTTFGLIYFQEYLTFETINWIIFPIAVVLTVFGAYIESLREFTIDNQHNHDDNGQDDNGGQDNDTQESDKHNQQDVAIDSINVATTRLRSIIESVETQFPTHYLNHENGLFGIFPAPTQQDLDRNINGSASVPTWIDIQREPHLLKSVRSIELAKPNSKTARQIKFVTTVPNSANNAQKLEINMLKQNFNNIKGTTVYSPFTQEMAVIQHTVFGTQRSTPL